MGGRGTIQVECHVSATGDCSRVCVCVAEWIIHRYRSESVSKMSDSSF